MKKILDSMVFTVIVGTFVLTLAYFGTAQAQTGPVPRGPATAAAPPGGNLPVQPHNYGSTANGPLTSTPSSGVVNQPTGSTAPAANSSNAAPVNTQLGQPNYATPNANSGMNGTPASGQTPAQSATTNSAGQTISP